MIEPDPDERPYPAVMYGWPNPPIEVRAADFVAQPDAADLLGVAGFTIGRLIAEGRLRAAVHAGTAGVTRTSLEEERGRRSHSPSRIKALGRSLLHWLSP